MTTPPKAPCHSCNGTGIDPVVGFLDCEFCTPAFAGVSLSAPEQPEPKCETCNDHGEIGCLRPDGYDGERCPDCNPAVVKRYYVHWNDQRYVADPKNGNLVMAEDFDRVTAELETMTADRDAEKEMKAKARDQRDAQTLKAADTQKRLEESHQRESRLQALLTAADERADVLETENKRLDLMVSQADYNYDADRVQFKARIDVLEGLLISWLKDFGRTHSGLHRLKERTQAALKPAEPAKDEHVCTGCGSKGWTANCKECVPY